MVKTITTISLDSEIKKEAKENLQKEFKGAGMTLSFFIEQSLIKYNENKKKEGK